jgi:hypothetical protein
MGGGFRPWSDGVDVDDGELVGGCLDDVTIVMRLDELGPVDRRPAGGRARGRRGVADRERCDGGAELMIRREHPVVAVAMLAWRWYQVGKTVEQLVGREVDDALGVGCGRLRRASGADSGAALVAGERVADPLRPAVSGLQEEQPLECECGADALADEVLDPEFADDLGHQSARLGLP